MEGLIDDLGAEHDELDGLVADAQLPTPTPAPGWTVADQISHLWYFDQRAVLALEDPATFAADSASLLATMAGGRDPALEQGRALDDVDLLAAWRRDRARLLERLRRSDPTARVPWYGPPMGLRSFATARLMETWAHGQDVADGLGVRRTPTDRLRHVAHIGIGARTFSYVANGLAPSAAPPRVELRGPSGDTWTWGDEGARDQVRGAALDFCLVVTQRRHLDDVDLEIVGPAATQWMAIAQAFAGPPGQGRRPGQFRPLRGRSEVADEGEHLRGDQPVRRAQR